MIQNIVLTGMLVLIPAILFSFFLRSDPVSLKKRLSATALLTVVSIIPVFLCIRFIPEWTWYEYLTADYVLAVVLGTVFHIFTDRKISIRLILERLCLTGAGIAAYSIVTYGQACIHSDTAIASLLARSQIYHKNLFPDTWAYANGEIWFLTLNILTLPFTVLLENQSLARELGSLAAVGAAAVCVYLHNKKLFQDGSWVISIPVIFIFMSGAADLCLYSAPYAGILMWLTVFTLLLYHMSDQKERRPAIGMFLLLNISVNISGIRYMAEIIVPLWLTCMVMLYLESREHTGSRGTIMKKAGMYSGLILIPAGIGYGVIYQNIRSTHLVNDTANNTILFADSLNEVWENLILTIVDMFSNFGFSGGAELFTVEGIRNLISISVCLLMVFIVPVLQAGKIAQETKGVQLFYIFMVFHNLIFVLLGVLFGKAATARYMLSVVYVSVIVSSGYIMRYWISGSRDCRMIWSSLFIAASVFSCAAMILQGSGWQQQVVSKKQCMNRLIEKGFDRYKGYATYWNAYESEIYSDLRLHFAAVSYENDPLRIRSFPWLVDMERYLPQEQGSFFMLDAEENEEIGDSLEQIYGSASEIFCLNDWYVYVWDYDICENQFQGKYDGSKNYLSQMQLSGAVLDEPAVWEMKQMTEEHTQNTGGKSIYIFPDTSVYGPYLELGAGEYLLTIDTEMEGEAACRITADSAERILAEYQLKSGRNEVEFVLQEDADEVEFPIRWDGAGCIKVNRISLEKR